MSDGETHILVTGGAGYIGSHTCKLLAAAGYLPVVLDDLSTGHDWAVKWGPLIVGDVGDSDALAHVFEAYRPVAVLHFAGSAYVGESMQQPGRYFRNNTVNTLSLLEAMLAHDVNQLVFSSTCATYGIPGETPIPSHHPQVPINPYGESKVLAERQIRWFCDVHGMRAVILRYFNAAGADPGMTTGEVHDPEYHLLPLVLDVALGRREKISIFGSDYDTHDGTCVRDYTHVLDLAAAHVAALDAMAAQDLPLAVNLGAGIGLSVRQVIDAVSAVTGQSIDVETTDRRPGDPAELVACTEQAHRLLGWEPTHSDIQTIVRTAWDWHRKWYAS